MRPLKQRAESGIQEIEARFEAITNDIAARFAGGFGLCIQISIVLYECGSCGSSSSIRVVE